MYSSFTPVGSFTSTAPASTDWVRQMQENYQTTQAKKREAIGANIDASAQDELAARNEATAARQNRNATLNREGTRAGGGRYRRRGLFSPGGSGLDAANSKARVEARKKAAYASADAEEAAKMEMESRQNINAAMTAYANRKTGFHNGAFYL